MSRPRKVFSSWRSSETGELFEGDIKIYADEDGSYDIESNASSIGVVVGADRSNPKHTVITKISDPSRLKDFKGYASVGDVLVAINDRVVIEIGCEEVNKIVKQLMVEGKTRRLRFFNPRKFSLAAYKKRALFLGQSPSSPGPTTDLLGFSCTADDYLRDKEFNRVSAPLFKQRDEEWVEYLKSIGGAENLKPAGVFKPSADLKQMCRRGIPVAYRCLIWQKISLSSLVRLQYPKDYYQSLLARISDLKQKVRDDIEKDVDRTFPEHEYFASGGKGEGTLRRVLQAFALHNPEIGYCQSLNFVAGMMLILMPEEESFWLLVTVVEKLLPPDYYTKTMVGTYVDQFVLAHIIKKYLPKVHRTLESHQLQLPLITVQWFMCLFVNTLRPEVTLRVWDIFLNEGNKVLFRIAGALFKLHEPRLLAVKDASDLFEVLRCIGKDVVDADKLIALAYKAYTPARALMRKVTLSRPLSNTVNGRNISTDGTGNGTDLNSSTHASIPSSSALHLTISPRLTSKSSLGAVPTDLRGLGLAHTGPVDAYERMLARLSSHQGGSETDGVGADLQSDQPVDGCTPEEVVQEATLQLALKQVSDHLLEDELSEDGSKEGTGGVKGEDDPSTASSEVDTSSPLNIPVSTAEDEKSVEMSASDMHDPVFTEPELLMKRLSTSTVADKAHGMGGTTIAWDAAVTTNYMFSAQYVKKLHRKKSTSGHRGVTAAGREPPYFDFHRCDLALWRSSFRPALEERYERMEAARVAWVASRKNSTYTGVGEGEALYDGEVRDDSIVMPLTKAATERESTIDPEEREQKKEVDAMMQRYLGGLSPAFAPSVTPVRRSVGALPGNRRSLVLPAAQSEADEAEETAATYRIDQEIDLEK